MSYHTRPECVAPDDQRCGALVIGYGHWDWAKSDHQCPKRANQMRGSTPVCHVHAKAKIIVPYGERQ